MKPADFLIGVLDFFAILLPGSIATWLVTRYLPPGLLYSHFTLGPGKTEPDLATLWTAFLLSSYVLGHLVGMAGSRLDTSYDRWRQRTKPSSSDKTYLAADAVRKRLTPALTDSAFTTLKWSKAFLAVKAPGSRTEIDRLEADSKFFRSLVVVSPACALHFLIREAAPGMGIGCLLLAALAYKRYTDRRWAMTELSYATAVIVSETSSPAAPPSSRSEETDA